MRRIDCSSANQRNARWAEEHVGAECLRDRTAVRGGCAEGGVYRAAVHRIQRGAVCDGYGTGGQVWADGAVADWDVVRGT